MTTNTATSPELTGRAAWNTLLSFSATPTTSFESLRAQYGDVVRLSVLGQRVVLLSDPRLIGEVLLDKEAVFHKDVVTSGLSEFLGLGLLTSEDAIWRKQRKLIAPSLTKKHVATYAQAMVDQTVAYAKGVGSGGERDVHDDMTELTLAIVVETLFGSELPQNAARIGSELDAVMAAFQNLVQTWRRFFPQWVPFAARRRVRRASRELDAIVHEMIGRKRAEGVGGTDLLSRLLAARDDEGSGMSDAQLRDEIVTLLLAGHETTANALVFGLYLLSRHPDAVRGLRDERQRVLGGREATFEDLPQLTFADAVFRESMRLYPPAYMIGRSPTRDIELGGHAIPKGSQILISPWTLHHDPRFYDDPLAFRPERWLGNLAERLPKNSYLPFGGGPRVCVGNHFAMMEGALVLTTLIGHLDFAPINDVAPELMCAVTLRPRGGLELLVTPRG